MKGYVVLTAVTTRGSDAWWSFVAAEQCLDTAHTIARLRGIDCLVARIDTDDGGGEWRWRRAVRAKRGGQ